MPQSFTSDFQNRSATHLRPEGFQNPSSTPLRREGFKTRNPQSITREKSLDLARISLSYNRLLSYQGGAWFHYLPKVPMSQSLMLSDGHPPRGTLILDLTTRPRTVEIFQRLYQ